MSELRPHVGAVVVPYALSMRRTDLTGFSALLGESMTSCVGLLERVLGGAHYPSLGRYKEKLLADTIRTFLPTSVEVGTGFVLFPHEDDSPVVPAELYDPLNQSTYSVSKQCDIIVYDASTVPVVFKDGEFVVVRPEAVRAIIEVKGAINLQQTRETLASFHDFGLKWLATQKFYKSHSQALTRSPGLYIMAWDIKRTRSGRRATSPASLRDAVVDFYSGNLVRGDLAGYPLLDCLFVHNEAEILATHFFGAENEQSFGWSCVDGRFIRVADDGSPYRDKDRTVAALLARLHMNAGRETFNRFFSYTEEIHGRDPLGYEYRGYSPLWGEHNLNTDDASQIGVDKI